MIKSFLLLIGVIGALNTYGQIDAIKIAAAKKAMDNKDYQITLDELNEVTSAGRNNKMFLYYKGYAYYYLKQYDSANVYLKKYLLMDINNTDVANTIADIEYQRRKEIELTSHIIHQIKIGSQMWEYENLNACIFRNGDIIPEAETEAEWKKASEEGKPAWCYYDGDASNGKKYGKLYNWYALTDERGLAPQGWHIPDDDEWSTLINYLGGESYAGKKMKSAFGWENNGNGDNSSNFSALPGGHRSKSGDFDGVGLFGYFWSADNNNNTGWVYRLFEGELPITINRLSYSYGWGFSVRCIKN